MNQHHELLEKTASDVRLHIVQDVQRDGESMQGPVIRRLRFVDSVKPNNDWKVSHRYDASITRLHECPADTLFCSLDHWESSSLLIMQYTDTAPFPSLSRVAIRNEIAFAAQI
ncbi:hypothetical protein N7G274_003041 [Stereocaulon virgatum]|uniref:Uncharacterized protein n=1 Tax=Stereocaulon virgatum TaxID=373712 RepID=A0ABR4AFP3_9LECA